MKLDDELSKELEKFPNMSETTREALRLYIGLIPTSDTIPILKKSYSDLWDKMDSKFEYYDSMFKQLEKLINILETRM